MSTYESSITNPKKQLEFYKDLSEQLLKENQELKKQLENYKKLGFKHLQDQNVELNKKYVNAVTDYETTMAEKNELKKQFEERTKMYQNAYNYSQKMESKAIILKMQQKEFIKYLQDEIKFIENKVFNLPYPSNERNYLICIENKLIKTLQKYKEIIGDDK